MWKVGAIKKLISVEIGKDDPKYCQMVILKKTEEGREEENQARVRLNRSLPR